MLAFLPLLAYFPAVLVAVLAMSGLGAKRNHVVFWLFVAYSAPYALRFALQSVFEFPWSSLQLLSSRDFVETTLIMNGLLAAAALVYRGAYRWYQSRQAADQPRAMQWIDFTERWGELVWRYLLAVALGCVLLGAFVRFVVQGDRYVLGFAADVESRQASMGWGFVNFILSQISVTIILIALELRRPRLELALVFLGLVTLALLSGSKGGFLLPLVYILSFAYFRGRLRLRAINVLVIGALGIGSLVIGVILRTWIEMGAFDPASAFSPIALLAPALGRFFAFDIAQVMIAQPARYLGIVGDYRGYFVGAVVPAALWPAKPLNPCLLLADAVDFPLVSCVAPGWVGGVLILLGPIGVVLAPLVVGVAMARITWRSSTLPDAISLRQPLTFSVALLWLGIVNEGGYYQLIPVYLPVLLTLGAIYLGILIANGRLGLLPAFAPKVRVRRARS
jgi:hypothetical protein